MDRLQRIALERRAADEGADRLAIRLFGVSALLLVGIAGLGMAVISMQLFSARDAGMILAIGGACGWPVFWLGRRHARRR